MNKLVLLFVMLLLISVVGCSSGDSITGPDTSDQSQADITTQKSASHHEPPGEGDPGTGVEGPGPH